VVRVFGLCSNFLNGSNHLFFQAVFLSVIRVKYLPTQLKILYLGCGSGGDTLYFKNRGYQVDVIDDSAELVVKVRELTGVKVNQLSFSASQIRP